MQRGSHPPDPARTAEDASATEPPAPPPPPERRISLPFEIFTASQRLGTYLDRALEGTGIRPAEYAVYSLMLEAGPRTPSELAAMLGMPLSTLSDLPAPRCSGAATRNGSPTRPTAGRCGSS